MSNEKEIRVTYKIRLKDDASVDDVAIQIRTILKRIFDKFGKGKQTLMITTKDNNE